MSRLPRRAAAAALAAFLVLTPVACKSNASPAGNNTGNTDDGNTESGD